MIEVNVFGTAGPDKVNEDYYAHYNFSPDCCLIVVADGMGGLSLGDVASRLAVCSIIKYFKERYSFCLEKDCIQRGVLYANEVIKKECYSRRIRMGASVAILLIKGARYWFSSLGDVRIYKKVGDIIQKMTSDHVLYPNDHSYITRCVNGRDFRYPIEVHSSILSETEELFMATDGYYTKFDIMDGNMIGIPNDDATCLRIRML